MFYLQSSEFSLNLLLFPGHSKRIFYYSLEIVRDIFVISSIYLLRIYSFQESTRPPPQPTFLRFAPESNMASVPSYSLETWSKFEKNPYSIFILSHRIMGWCMLKQRKTGQECCAVCKAFWASPSRTCATSRETLAIMRWSYQRCPRKNYRRYSLQAAGNSLLGGSHENCWWHASPNVAIRVGFLNWLA